MGLSSSMLNAASSTDWVQPDSFTSKVSNADVGNFNSPLSSRTSSRVREGEDRPGEEMPGEETPAGDTPEGLGGDEIFDGGDDTLGSGGGTIGPWGEAVMPEAFRTCWPDVGVLR